MFFVIESLLLKTALGLSEAQLERVRLPGHLGQGLAIVRVVRRLGAQRELDAEPADALFGRNRRLRVR
jgi:hypothetical protein